MSPMSIAFIHPPLAAFPSGGNHYNEKILQHAKRNNFPIDSLSVEENRPLKEVFSEIDPEKYRLIVLDSLFISAFHHGKPPRIETPIALLLHDLPSQNPMLTFAQRKTTETAEKTAMALADRFIVTGGSLKTILLGRYPEKLTWLCEPGVDPIFRNVLEADNQNSFSNPVQWLTVANLIPRKNYLGILKIAERLSYQSWHWHIVGDETLDGACASAFRQEINRLNLSLRITIHGPLMRQRIVSLMKKTDIFVFGSVYETYGMVLAEASAMNIPIVAMCVGEAERLIRHGETGYLAGYGEWDRFEGYLSELTEDSQLRYQFRNCQRSTPRRWEQSFVAFSKACFLPCNRNAAH